MKSNRWTVEIIYMYYTNYVCVPIDECTLLVIPAQMSPTQWFSVTFSIAANIAHIKHNSKTIILDTIKSDLNLSQLTHSAVCQDGL